MPEGGPWLRHIGIYGYRAGFLRRFAKMPPGRLERVESLEQLRALEAGHRIAVALTPEPFPPGVAPPDNPAPPDRHTREANDAAAAAPSGGRPAPTTHPAPAPRPHRSPPPAGRVQHHK